MTCQLAWIYDSTPEMRLRLRPLRENWEVRGPGMLRFLEKTMPWIELPEQVQIRLVQPADGGGGRVVGEREIEFEAVLANRYPQLPEVARLLWLILHIATGDLSDQQVALISPTLVAAEYVELARCDAPTIDLALKYWPASTQPILGSSCLLDWWETTGRESSTERNAWQKAASELPSR